MCARIFFLFLFLSVMNKLTRKTKHESSFSLSSSNDEIPHTFHQKKYRNDTFRLKMRRKKGTPGLEPGSIDLQSNALLLSYVPVFYFAALTSLNFTQYKKRTLHEERRQRTKKNRTRFKDTHVVTVE